MPLWRLYYHLVWSTKERYPYITPDIESTLYGYIVGKANALGCITHAIGGVENHVHLVSSIPPKLSIADFVQNIKGSSAHYVNHDIDNYSLQFSWQRGYGIFSMGSKQVSDAISYVKNQKTNHQQGTIIPALETDTDEDDGPTLIK